MIATLGAAQNGDELALAGRFEEAVIAYDEALAQTPDHAGLLQRKAYSLFASGDLDKAGAIYDKAISIDGSNPDLWRASGLVAEQLGNFAAALQRYNHALVLTPDSPQLWSDKADVLLALGHAEEALAAYRHSDRLRAPVAHDWTIRGHRFYNADRSKEADACYRAALELDAKEFEAWWGRGLAATAGNEVGLALEYFNKAVSFADRPEDKARILTDKGNELAKQQDGSIRAMDCYDQALTFDPRHEEARLGRAVLFENLHRYSQASDAYGLLTELNPKRADAWLGKARCLTNQPERIQEALECYDNAIKFGENSFSAHSDKSYVLMELKRYTDSIDECDIAIQMERAEVVPWANKAFALMELGRYEECEKILREGIQIVDQPLMLMRNLNLLYSDYTFDEQKALEGTRELAKLDPDPTVQTAYAECLFRVGKYGEARDVARGIEQTETGYIRSVSGFISLASCALDGRDRERAEQFCKLMTYLTEKEWHPVTQREYVFRGLTKWLGQSNADPITKFVLLTTIDLLTGKVDRHDFSYLMATSPKPTSETASVVQPPL
jgi:tetratricopeptide (TPR) repeat protein